MKSPHIKELFDLSGKVALVTGGARNLGCDMALALAEAGADVAITSRTLDNARGTAERIARETSKRVKGFQCDVRDEANVDSMVDAVLLEFAHINILVNNAGNVSSTPDTAQIEKRPFELWRDTLAVNLDGVFLCSRAVIVKSMMAARGGNIINIASTTALAGKDRRIYKGTSMGGATVDYHAAKGGVLAMTRDMAVYLAPFGIRVNSICPGGFWRGHTEAFTRQYSETVPMGRMGIDGKEMKGAVVFFASEASSYVTGANLAIDGGLTAW